MLAMLAHIGKIQKELEILGKEQHIQNMDIIDLIKSKLEISDILISHAEVIQYLADKDDLIGKKNYYSGPIGEA
jgi:hypothetical protein